MKETTVILAAATVYLVTVTHYFATCFAAIVV
jgi:hypothetical protein